MPHPAVVTNVAVTPTIYGDPKATYGHVVYGHGIAVVGGQDVRRPRGWRKGERQMANRVVKL